MLPEQKLSPSLSPLTVGDAHCRVAVAGSPATISSMSYVKCTPNNSRAVRRGRSNSMSHPPAFSRCLRKQSRYRSLRAIQGRSRKPLSSIAMPRPTMQGGTDFFSAHKMNEINTSDIVALAGSSTGLRFKLCWLIKKEQQPSCLLFKNFEISSEIRGFNRWHC